MVHLVPCFRCGRTNHLVGELKIQESARCCSSEKKGKAIYSSCVFFHAINRPVLSTRRHPLCRPFLSTRRHPPQQSPVPLAASARACPFGPTASGVGLSGGCVRPDSLSGSYSSLPKRVAARVPSSAVRGASGTDTFDSRVFFRQQRRSSKCAIGMSVPRRRRHHEPKPRHGLTAPAGGMDSMTKEEGN